MPCRCDDMPGDGTLRRLEQMLCALLTVLDDDLPNVLCRVDWAEAGIRRSELDGWWRDHKEADRRRREAEAFATRRDSLRDSAAAKLSPDERRALGLK